MSDETRFTDALCPQCGSHRIWWRLQRFAAYTQLTGTRFLWACRDCDHSWIEAVNRADIDESPPRIEP